MQTHHNIHRSEVLAIKKGVTFSAGIPYSNVCPIYAAHNFGETTNSVEILRLLWIFIRFWPLDMSAIYPDNSLSIHR